jgi:mannose-6-phosphate isomerase-like protein (cupin superfamily)
MDMSAWRCLPGHCERGLEVDLKNVSSAKAWFEILQTAERSQTAMMTLKPGDATGEKAEAHWKSDQVLLMLKGELNGEVGDDRLRLRKGDVIIIPAGVKHRFTNNADKPAVSFNVYAPPAYPAGSKG